MRTPTPETGKILAVLFVLVPAALATAPQEASAALAWPRISFVQRAVGLARPVQVTHAGDGSGTLYVVEQGGRIRTLKNGTVGAVPFLDIGTRVVAVGEQGLLGLAFSPRYATNGTFYVNYTRAGDGATVVARYRVTQNPDVADPASEEILLEILQPFANHNGGQIAFGPDGFLYIGTGDGGSGGDPQGNAQNPASLLGKMLRIDVESGTVPYGVPPDNPFAGQAGYRGEIWAMGLRNPWRFSFDRATGDLYIGDVGQSSFEEVDFQLATSAGGENYGWNVMEGNSCFGGAACNPSGFVFPVAVYDHSRGKRVPGSGNRTWKCGPGQVSRLLKAGIAPPDRSLSFSLPALRGGAALRGGRRSRPVRRLNSQIRTISISQYRTGRASPTGFFFGEPCGPVENPVAATPATDSRSCRPPYIWYSGGLTCPKRILDHIRSWYQYPVLPVRSGCSSNGLVD